VYKLLAKATTCLGVR